MQIARQGTMAEGYDPAWTEYTLYYLFAYHSGLHDLFHTPGEASRTLSRYFITICCILSLCSCSAQLLNRCGSSQDLSNPAILGSVEYSALEKQHCRSIHDDSRNDMACITFSNV